MNVYLQAVAFQAKWEPRSRQHCLRKHTATLGNSDVAKLAYAKPPTEQLRLLDRFQSEERAHARVAKALLRSARTATDPMVALDLRKQAQAALANGYRARGNAGTVEFYMQPPVIHTPSKRRYTRRSRQTASAA